jgi:hypothetical protein
VWQFEIEQQRFLHFLFLMALRLKYLVYIYRKQGLK